MNISIVQQIPIANVCDLLTSALERGSNYWYMIESVDEPVNYSNHRTLIGDDDKSFYTVDKPLNPGGCLIISDLEDPTRPHVTLDLAAIKRGLQLMAEKESRHFGDFMRGDDDATTGDVFLQLCCFGEVIYG